MRGSTQKKGATTATHRVQQLGSSLLVCLLRKCGPGIILPVPRYRFRGNEDRVLCIPMAVIRFNPLRAISTTLVDALIPLGNHLYGCLFCNRATVALSDVSFIVIEVSVIALKLLLLIGLEVLRNYEIILNFGNGHIRDSNGSWQLNFTYLRSNAFIQRTNPKSV